MLRMKSLIAASCGLALCVAATANASVTFNQAQLLGMSISLLDSPGWNPGFGTGVLSANPTYQDGETPMQGTAGATGGLLSGSTAYYRLNPVDLAAFNLAIGSGLETLDVVGANDNNQLWDVGIWYKNLAGIIVTDFVTLSPATSGGLSLALPVAVLDAGVAVRNSLTQSDDYHASWAVPEPMAIVVWTGLIGIGSLIGVRRQDRS